MKNAFYFIYKTLFILEVLNFCISIFPSFFPVGQCFRGWSKIHLKVYDIINCLNKNLLTHFVWYLEKEKRYDIEILSIDSAQSLFRLQNKFRKIPLLVMYYLTKFDDVRSSNFWVISKITSNNLCMQIHDIINYFSFICPFGSGKCGKEKITKIWISQEPKEFLRWNKNIFHIVLEGLSFGQKKIKNSIHKL